MEVNRTRKNFLALIAVAFSMILWIRTDVYAQVGGPCAEDLAKFCKDVQPGGGRIAKCLKEHEKELSATCPQDIAEVQKRWKEANQACHDDVLKFCKEVKPGQRRIARCLKGHQNEISPECQEKLAQPRKTK
jgi:hypothetical protein